MLQATIGRVLAAHSPPRGPTLASPRFFPASRQRICRKSPFGFSDAHFSSHLGRPCPCHRLVSTGDVGLPDQSENGSGFRYLALEANAFFVPAGDSVRGIPGPPSQAFCRNAPRAFRPRLAQRLRVLTVGGRLLPAGFRSAALRPACILNRQLPLSRGAVYALGCSTGWPRTFVQRKTNTYEKRNAHQRFATGRMPDCDH